MIMKLTTHVAFSEIVIDNDFSWAVQILDMNRVEKENFKGEAVSRTEAIEKALAKINMIADDYLRPVIPV